MTFRPALIQGEGVFPLHRLTNTIGRPDRVTNEAPTIDLGPLDPERTTSRRHAEIRCREGRAWLRDLGSTNGTQVNGERVGDIDRELMEGDSIEFGRARFTYLAECQWPSTVWPEWPEATSGPAPSQVTPQLPTLLREPGLGGGAVFCGTHPERPAVGLCLVCLHPFCEACLPDRGEAPLQCEACFRTYFPHKTAATAPS